MNILHLNLFIYLFLKIWNSWGINKMIKWTPNWNALKKQPTLQTLVAKPFQIQSEKKIQTLESSCWSEYFSYVFGLFDSSLMYALKYLLNDSIDCGVWSDNSILIYKENISHELYMELMLAKASLRHRKGHA